MNPSRRHLGWIITGLVALLIASQTLVPQPSAIRALPFPRFCFACEDLAGIDILFNLLLFIPLGIGLRLSGSSRKRAVAIAAALSGAIELLQLSVVIGRDASIRDLLMNTVGAAIGFLLADGWRRLAFPSRAEARRLCAVGAAFWLMLNVAEAALLGRAFPPSIWYGQWAPDGVFPATFSGQILTVRLDSIDLAGGQLRDSSRVRAALLQDRWTLTVNATTGKPTLNLASVFSIFDGDEREMLVVGQRGIDLLARYRTRAATMGLRSPSIVVPGAFALPPGEPIRISLSFDRGAIFLAAAASGRTVSRDVSATPSWGWSVLSPLDAPIGSLAGLWSGLWAAALLVPTGYWMAWGIPKVQAVAFGGLIVLLGTGLTPILFRLPPARMEEWMAAGGGLLAGWWLGGACRH